MAIITNPSDPGSDPVLPGDDLRDAEITLESVGTTSFTLRGGDEAQLQADVSNSKYQGENVTVAFKFGGETVATAEDTVPENGTETVAETVTRSELRDMGISPGDYPLRAVLRSGSTWDEQTEEYGTMHIKPVSSGGGDGGESGGSSPLSAIPSVAGLPGPVVAGIGALLLLAVVVA